MPDLLDFLPIRAETAARIRARLEADVNAGVDPEDPAFVDTTIGGFWWDLTQAAVLEIERLWDSAASETPAVGFLPFAWGDYLDEHGATLGVTRRPASTATGDVTFTGPAGEVITIGTIVSRVPPDPLADEVAYEVTRAGVLNEEGRVTLPVRAQRPGSEGNAPINSATTIVSASPASAVTNDAPIGGGAEVETDESYRTRLLERLTRARGAGTIADYENWALSQPGISNVSVQPLFAGPGTVRVVVTDEQNRPVSAAVVEALQNTLDPPNASTTLVGAQDLTADTVTVASTEGFSLAGTARIAGQLLRYTGRTRPGVTPASLTGVTGGTGTAADGEAVHQTGVGRGLAPIGATVVVATPQARPLPITATVELREGYSLEGFGGTIAVRERIERNLGQYVARLRAGGEVVRGQIIARILEVPGVHDVALTDPAANVTIADTEVIVLGVVTLNEGAV